MTKAKADQTIGVRLELQSLERERLDSLVTARAVGDVLNGMGGLLNGVGGLARSFTTMSVTGAVMTLATMQGIVEFFPSSYSLLKHFPGVGPPATDAMKEFWTSPSFSSWYAAAEEAAESIGPLPGQNP